MQKISQMMWLMVLLVLVATRSMAEEVANQAEEDTSACHPLLNEPSAEITTTPCTLTNAAFRERCRAYGVSDGCVALCSYTPDASRLLEFVGCLVEIQNIFKAGTCGRDNSACCKKARVPAVCLDFCKPPGPVGLKNEYVQCASTYFKIMACIKSE
jgi:DB module protein